MICDAVSDDVRCLRLCGGKDKLCADCALFYCPTCRFDAVFVRARGSAAPCARAAPQPHAPLATTHFRSAARAQCVMMSARLRTSQASHKPPAHLLPTRCCAGRLQVRAAQHLRSDALHSWRAPAIERPPSKRYYLAPRLALQTARGPRHHHRPRRWPPLARSMNRITCRSWKV